MRKQQESRGRREVEIKRNVGKIVYKIRYRNKTGQKI